MNMSYPVTLKSYEGRQSEYFSLMCRKPIG
jgi:hypothetical protein